jgi:AcrR family transcriptional regulator
VTPAAAKPATAKGAATRARLLAAASAELAERGRIELAPVAEAVGISPSALYRYFDGRDGLVAAVVEQFYDDYEAEVFARADIPGSTWAGREALRLEREVEFFYGHPLGPSIACGLLREPAAAAVDVERTRAQGLQAGRNIRAGQRAGELDRDVDAALAGAGIMGAVRSMLAEALAREEPPPPSDVARTALRAGAALLSLNPSSQGGPR